MKFQYQNYPAVAYTVTVGKSDIAIPDQIIKVASFIVIPKTDKTKGTAKVPRSRPGFDLKGARVFDPSAFGIRIFQR